MSLNITERADCCGCGACYNICPAGCITMEEDREGFSYPVVHGEKCISCGLCENVCPVKGNECVASTAEGNAYAAINLSEQIREKSSSGGIFSLLAEEIISNGGKVYGATFTEEWEVAHEGIEDIESLHKLYGSKYVQSSTYMIYKQIKEELESGRKVMFSGTPCQNAGLIKFLGEKYDNLYCVDIVCHGVPSPLVWKLYLKYLERRLDVSGRSRESKPSFRSKNEGWLRYSVSIPYENDTEYRELHNTDLYMLTFLKNISLRPSCYKCRFKPSTLISDITLADLWGVQNVCPGMFDDKGTSLVLTNSEKGRKLFSAVSGRMKCRAVSYEEAIRYNPSAVKSVKVPPKREYFFRNIQKENIEILMRRVTKDGIGVQVKQRVIHELRKVEVLRKIYHKLNSKN